MKDEKSLRASFHRPAFILFLFFNLALDKRGIACSNPNKKRRL